MPILPALRKRRPPRWRDYYTLLFLFLCAVLLGPWFTFYGLYADHRDRPSLQWPKVSGMLVQERKRYSVGRTSDEMVNVSYTYAVNGHHYVGHHIPAWSTQWDAYEDDRSMAFANAHPVGSVVAVYYDPEQPDNAALLPGPDVAGNRFFMIGGCAILVCGLFLVTMNFNKLAAMKSAIQAREARHRTVGPHKHGALRHGFASYEPACKRKLNIFPDQQCLDEVLGHRGKPLQDWKAEDRMIDVAGCEYRIVKEPGKKAYDLSPTGEKWTYEQLLGVAEEDERAAKKKPEALRQLLDEVGEKDRMGVLMKALDAKSEMPQWFEAAFVAFLVLFALGCAAVGVAIFELVTKYF